MSSSLSSFSKRKNTNMLNKIPDSAKVESISNVSSDDMAQLGLMASSIAHDFNNLLTSIMGHMSLALLNTPSDDDVRTHIERAVKATKYASALTTQLLNYSHKQPQTQAIEYIDLNKVVTDVLGLVETVLLTDLTIELNLDESLPPIKASQTHVQQIVMNLLVNAAEAIDDPNNGKIVVYTGNYCASKGENGNRVSEFQDMPPGDYVVLQISDNGRGIDKDVLDRIFDPFFTTKPKGRGLGLATIRGIVCEYQGRIDVESTPGRRTSFRVCFPYRVENFSPLH